MKRVSPALTAALLVLIACAVAPAERAQAQMATMKHDAGARSTTLTVRGWMERQRR